MNIPQVTTAPTGAAGIITPIAPTQVQAAAQAQTAAALIAQTTVDLSPLGKFLSAVTLFQKRMLELQANPAAVAESEEAVAALASSVVAVADSANELQASSLTGTSDDQSLGTLFGQQFDAQSDIEGDSDRLSAIGLTFSSSILGDEDVLDVDTAVLQAALENDPQGTTALLARTAAAFGALAGTAAVASADPSILLPEDAAENDPLALTPTQTAQEFPQLGDDPAPVTTDGAFLQELLAETPRPALALTQAPPPSVTEANANFAAQRAAGTDAQERVERLPDPRATPAPPDLPDTASDVAAAATANIGTRNATPPELPPAASDVATAATANAGTPRAAPADIDNQPRPAQAGAQAVAEQNARTEADQALAAQDATRAANARMADTIAAEREANERIAATVAAERAAQASELEERASEDATRTRLNAQDVEERRLARDREELRLERAREARDLDADELELPATRRERVTATVAQPVLQADQPVGTIVPQPTPQPVNHAQQLARDPATLAAIAAYNLNAGPFAALNGRRELGAPRADIVPAVETVRKVAALDTDASTGESTRPGSR